MTAYRVIHDGDGSACTHGTDPAQFETGPRSELAQMTAPAPPPPPRRAAARRIHLEHEEAAR